jgi:hypothetical protein
MEVAREAVEAVRLRPMLPLKRESHFLLSTPLHHGKNQPGERGEARAVTLVTVTAAYFPTTYPSHKTDKS